MAYWLDNFQNSIWKCGGLSEHIYTPHQENFTIVVPAVANDGGINSTKIKFNDIYLINDYGEKANVEILTDKPSGGWVLRNFRFLDSEKKFRTSDIEIGFSDFTPSRAGEEEQLYTLVFDINYDGERQVYKCNFITTSEAYDGRIYSANSQGRIDTGGWDDVQENACTITAYSNSGFTAISSGLTFRYATNTVMKRVFFKADNPSSTPMWSVTDDCSLTSTSRLEGDDYISVAISVKSNTGYTQNVIMTVRCTGADGSYSYLQYPLLLEGALGEMPAITSPERASIDIKDNDYVKNYKLYAVQDGRSYPIDLELENCTLSGVTTDWKGESIGDSNWAAYDEYGLCITTNPNNTYSKRSQTFTFTSDKGGSVSVYVEQDSLKGDAYLRYINSRVDVDYSGNTSASTISVPFAFAYVDLDTITFSSNKAFVTNQSIDKNYLFSDYSYGSGNLNIVVAKNTTAFSRVATLTISAKSLIDSAVTLTATINVTQDRMPNDGIFILNSILTISSASQTKTFSYTKDEDVVIDEVYCTPSANTECSFTTVPQLISVRLPENPSTNEKNYTVTVKSHIEGEYGVWAYNTISIKQMGRLTQVEKAIWEDTDMVLSSENEYVDYKLLIDNDEKYVGRAFIHNGSARVRLNEIVKHYMEENIDFDKEGLQSQGGYKKVDVYLSDDDWANEYFFKTYFFYNDWSYSEFEDYSLSYPISNKMDKRQYFLYTVIDSLASDGTSIIITKNHSYTDMYDFSNNMCTVVYPLYDVDTLNYKYSNSLSNPYSSGATVEYTCYDYCLYYKNRRGGWDSMLFNLTSKQTDKVTINTFDREYVAGSLEFGTLHHQKDIVEEWALKTPYLSDRQSKILSEHLLSSNKAYLHIFETDRIVPVNITNSSIAHTTWRNNGKKMIQYTVNVQNSQKKIVR